MGKKILKNGLVIVISISALIVISLLFNNRIYTYPEEIGKLELNYDVQLIVCINGSPAVALGMLDRIEQEQGYVDIEELEQLREKMEGIDGGYIIFSYRYPVQYFSKPIIEVLSDGCGGTDVTLGENNGNVLYFYRVRHKIEPDHHDFLIPLN